MKIFVILSRFPYPLEKGDKLRAYHQLVELAKNHEVILCALSDQKVEDSWKEILEKKGIVTHVFQLKKPLLYWNTLKQILTNKPYQTGYFFQRGIQTKILRLLEKEAPDHIYCQLIRTTEYVKNIHHIPKTLDYMDALSKGMYRRAEIASGVKKKLFRIEGKRLAEYENRIFDYFNHHTIISKQDRSFISHPQRDQIVIIENGIGEEFSNYPANNSPQYDLVFTGNMNYPPNVESAAFLAEEVYPLLKADFPNLTLLLSGADPNQRVKELAIKDKITVTGWIDDIRTSYAAGKLFVAPLQIGTGLQNKLLEAMAMGRPSITTPLANNALNAVHNETILIASNATEFAEAIRTLLTDPELYDRLAENGKTFVLKTFSWPHAVERLVQLMQKK
jgi:polysaccharide biosynthesis protein PslH